MMTPDDIVGIRARRVVEAIEATPEALERRSVSIAVLSEAYRQVHELCAQAAEATAARDASILRDVDPARLAHYISRQVVALAIGDGRPVVLDLRDRSAEN